MGRASRRKAQHKTGHTRKPEEFRPRYFKKRTKQPKVIGRMPKAGSDRQF